MSKVLLGKWVKSSTLGLFVDLFIRRVYGECQEIKGGLAFDWTTTIPAFALLLPIWPLDTPMLKNATLISGQFQKDCTSSKGKQSQAKSMSVNEGRDISSRKFHSNIIWLADTNYRIDLSNESVRSLATQRDYDPLVGSDQVGPPALWDMPKTKCIYS